MSALAGFIEVFLIGVGTPLTAACALPLYPGFLAYLADQSARGESDTWTVPVWLLGVFVLAGAVSFMGTAGLLFSFVLEVSLTTVVAVGSPIAFVLVLAISIALMADAEVFSRIPAVEPPQSRYPSATAFGYGFLFGAIVLPCNPGFIALFFARVPILFESSWASFLGFLSFGLGLGAPLLALALVSEGLGRRATRWLARNRTAINRVAGAIMFVVSIYYLLVVFDVLSLVGIEGADDLVGGIYDGIFGPIGDLVTGLFDAIFGPIGDLLP